MTHRVRDPKSRLVLTIFLALTLPVVSFGQLRVIMSGGFAVAYQELLPEFEKTTGITVSTTRGPSQGNGPDTIGAQLRRGLPADVVIMNREGLEELLAAGKIAAGTNVDLARVPLGLSVRAGAPKPDISNVAAFTQAVRDARSIASNSSAAIYLKQKLLPRLGMTDAAAKIADKGAPAVASGESDLVVLPVSELLHVPGVDFVGVIPAEVQQISVFSAAVVAGSKQIEEAKRLVAFLRSASAAPAIKRSGMEQAPKP